MTITREQLDAIERNARAELADADLCVPVDASVALQLVAVYRAALAWSEARWKHNDVALAHGLLSPAARQEFAVLDRLTESLDAVLRGTQ